MPVDCDNATQNAAIPGEPRASELPTAAGGTHGQILKSSALIGGSQLLNIGIGIVRTKTMAILLGPAGYGLFGLYSSITNVVQSIAGMGVSSSGVRQIAAAVGTGDTERIALTTIVLRRVYVVLGLLGATLLFAFARQVSASTFGSSEHATAIRFLSIAVFFQLVSWGQDALVQGMRRVGDLAKMQVLGALFGTLLSIPIVYVWREKGVVPSLVIVSLMYLVISWWYSRKIRVQTPVLTIAEVTKEAAALLKLGFAFMVTAFMTVGIAYGVRIMVLRNVGFAATGYYQSAWTLGGLYVGFILQAMGADFFPRLTAVVNDNVVCNRLVNEQMQVGVLLAGPGGLATLTCAPAVIAVFYSAKFGAAVEVLRWISFGAVLQVITWPMGFVILAKGRQGIYLFTQLAWTIVSLGLAYICVRMWGLNGAGIAFFGSAVFFGMIDYPVVRRLSGFRLSADNKKINLVLLSLLGVVFCGYYMLPFLWATLVGVIATLLSTSYSLWKFSTFIAWDQTPRVVQRFLGPFRMTFLRMAGSFQGPESR